MPEARRAYLKSFVHLYEGDPFLVRLLLEAGRFLVFLCVAVLEAAQDPSRRETWFTVAALKRQLAMYGYASGRQVDHLVARLREVGFLEQCRAPGDGRVRLLAATHKLRTHHTEWLATHYIPLAVLFPDHDYGPVLSRDPICVLLHNKCEMFNASKAYSVPGEPELPELLLSTQAMPLFAPFAEITGLPFRLPTEADAVATGV